MGERFTLGHRPGLDALRGIFVLAVLAGHSQWPRVGEDPALAGVGLFFVLSGFLITTLLVAEHDKLGRIRLGGFYLRRAARLYPALLAVGAVCLILGKPALDVLLGVVYLSDFALGSGRDMGLLTHTWSLAVEEQFYLIAPLTLLLARGRWRAWAIGASILAAGITVWRVAYWTGPNSLAWVYYGPTRIDGIILGCLLAIAFELRGQWTPPTWLVALAAAYVAFFASGLWGNERSMFTLGIVGLSLAAVVLIAWGVDQGGVLAAAPLVFFGRISYGLYLWHYPVFGFVDTRGLPEPADTVLKWALSIGVAAVSFYVWERPVQRWVRRRWGATNVATAMPNPVPRMNANSPSAQD